MTGVEGTTKDVAAAEAGFAARLAMLGPGDIAIDCGANVGKVARQMAATGAHVIAFEPDPEVFALLQTNMADHPETQLICAAVGVSEGEAVLRRSPYYRENPVQESEKNTICDDALTRRREGGWQPMPEADAVHVPLVDFPRFIAGQIAAHGRIALLKLDIEGMELPIIDALDQAGHLDSIDLTVAELHPWRFPNQRAQISRLRERIEARYAKTHVNLDWG